MSLPHLTLADVMSLAPYQVDADATLHDAQELLARHGIRHLPVVAAGGLIGVLSDRDIAAALALKASNPKNIAAGDVCARDIYVSHPDSALSDVALAMATHKYGSAVVTRDGDVVGIFTTTDACRALAQLMTPDSELLSR